MAVLSLAEHYEHGLMQIKDISSQNNIPVQYLAQIFSQLVKSEIIKSFRGKNGGYELSRTPNDITVLEILDVLEGGLELVEKENDQQDAITDLFSTAESKLKDVFNISLADLLAQQKENKHILNYEI